ncbi:MAG: hypothetical protein U9R64_15105 [Pseudomonadota bacterium]|nr:hypothetical protein [Pseudomonadota bacterium]
MTLHDYLTREGLTFTAFAGMIGTYPSTVERYAKGMQIPGRAMMKRIVGATNGEVMPNDYYGFHDAADIGEAADPSPCSSSEIIGAAASSRPTEGGAGISRFVNTRSCAAGGLR